MASKVCLPTGLSHYCGWSALTGVHCNAALGCLLGDHSTACKRKATAALMGISIDIKAKVQIIDECMTKVIELLKNGDQVTSSNAKATILSCCENPDVTERISAALSASERDSLLGPLPRFAHRSQ